eukprot:gene5825-7249_t
MISGDLPIFEHDRSIYNSSWDRLTLPMRKKYIPWAIIFGNHDGEGLMNSFEISSMDQEYELSYTRHGPNTISGESNYVLEIFSSSNSTDGQIGALIYMFDSDTKGCGENGSWGCIQPDQVQWYREQSQMYNHTQSVAFVHVPPIEVIDLWNNYQVWGDFGDSGSCCFYTDFSKFVDTMVEIGDIKGLYFGHDHRNDYHGNYHGIDMGYGRKSGFGSYSSKYPEGARVIELTELSAFNESSSPSSTITLKTWIRTMDGKRDDQKIHRPSFQDSVPRKCADGVFLIVFSNGKNNKNNVFNIDRENNDMERLIVDITNNSEENENFLNKTNSSGSGSSDEDSRFKSVFRNYKWNNKNLISLCCWNGDLEILKFVYKKIDKLGIKKDQRKINNLLYVIDRLLKKSPECAIEFLEFFNLEGRFILKDAFSTLFIDHPPVLCDRDVRAWFFNHRAEYTYTDKFIAGFMNAAIRLGDKELVKTYLNHGLHYHWGEHMDTAQRYCKDDENGLEMIKLIWESRSKMTDNYRSKTGYAPSNNSINIPISGMMGNLRIFEYLFDNLNYSLEDLPTFILDSKLPIVKLLWESPKYEKYRPKLMETSDTKLFKCFYGDLETLKYFHDHQIIQFTTASMDRAIQFGYFKIVKFLNENRTEGCSRDAIEQAFIIGQFEILQYLLQYKPTLPHIFRGSTLNTPILRDYHIEFIRKQRLPSDLERRIGLINGLSFNATEKLIEMGLKKNPIIQPALFKYGDIELYRLFDSKQLIVFSWDQIETAVKNGRVGMLKYLVQKKQALEMKQNDFKKIWELIQKCYFTGGYELLKYFIMLPGLLDHKDQSQVLVELKDLFYSVLNSNNNTDLFRFLLKNTKSIVSVKDMVKYFSKFVNKPTLKMIRILFEEYQFNFKSMDMKTIFTVFSKGMESVSFFRYLQQDLGTLEELLSDNDYELTKCKSLGKKSESHSTINTTANTTTPATVFLDYLHLNIASTLKYVFGQSIPKNRVLRFKDIRDWLFNHRVEYLYSDGDQYKNVRSASQCYSFLEEAIRLDDLELVKLYLEYKLYDRAAVSQYMFTAQEYSRNDDLTIVQLIANEMKNTFKKSNDFNMRIFPNAAKNEKNIRIFEFIFDLFVESRKQLPIDFFNIKLPFIKFVWENPKYDGIKFKNQIDTEEYGNCFENAEVLKYIQQNNILPITQQTLLNGNFEIVKQLLNKIIPPNHPDYQNITVKLVDKAFQNHNIECVKYIFENCPTLQFPNTLLPHRPRISLKDFNVKFLVENPNLPLRIPSVQDISYHGIKKLFQETKYMKDCLPEFIFQTGDIKSMKLIGLGLVRWNSIGEAANNGRVAMEHFKILAYYFYEILESLGKQSESDTSSSATNTTTNTTTPATAFLDYLHLNLPNQMKYIFEQKVILNSRVLRVLRFRDIRDWIFNHRVEYLYRDEKKNHIEPSHCQYFLDEAIRLGDSELVKLYLENKLYDRVAVYQYMFLSQECSRNDDLTIVQSIAKEMKGSLKDQKTLYYTNFANSAKSGVNIRVFEFILDQFVDSWNQLPPHLFSFNLVFIKFVWENPKYDRLKVQQHLNTYVGNVFQNEEVLKYIQQNNIFPISMQSLSIGNLEIVKQLLNKIVPPSHHDYQNITLRILEKAYLDNNFEIVHCILSNCPEFRYSGTLATVNPRNTLKDRNVQFLVENPTLPFKITNIQEISLNSIKMLVRGDATKINARIVKIKEIRDWFFIHRQEYPSIKFQFLKEAIIMDDLELVKLYITNGLYIIYEFWDYFGLAQEYSRNDDLAIVQLVYQEFCRLQLNNRLPQLNFINTGKNEKNVRIFEFILDLYLNDIKKSNQLPPNIFNCKLPLIKFIWDNPKYDRFKNLKRDDHDCPSCYYGNPEILKYLHENGLINITFSSISRATNFNYLGIIQYIHSIQVQTFTKEVFKLAIENNSFEILKYYIDNCPEFEEYKKNPLIPFYKYSVGIKDHFLNFLADNPNLPVQLKNLSLTYNSFSVIQRLVYETDYIQIGSLNIRNILEFGDIQLLELLESNHLLDVDWGMIEFVATSGRVQTTLYLLDKIQSKTEIPKVPTTILYNILKNGNLELTKYLLLLFKRFSIGSSGIENSMVTSSDISYEINNRGKLVDKVDDRKEIHVSSFPAILNTLSQKKSTVTTSTTTTTLSAAVQLLEYLHNENPKELKHLLHSFPKTGDKDRVLGNKDVRNWLFQHRKQYKFSDYINYQFLVEAIKLDDPVLVNLYISNGLCCKNKKYWFLVQEYSRNDNLEIIKLIPSNLEATSIFNDGWGAIDFSNAGKNEKNLVIFQYIVDEFVKVFNRLPSKIFNAKLPLVKLLWENKKYKSFQSSITQTSDILLTKCFNGDLETLKYFHSNRIVYLSNESMNRAIEFGYLDIVKYLYYNLSMSFDNKSIQKAFEKRDYEMVKFLTTIKPGYFSNLQLYHDATDYHVDGLSLNAIRKLIYINKLKTKPYDYVFVNGDIQLYKLLESHGLIDYHQSQIELAVTHGRVSMVEYLLKNTRYLESTPALKNVRLRILGFINLCYSNGCYELAKFLIVFFSNRIFTSNHLQDWESLKILIIPLIRFRQVDLFRFIVRNCIQPDSPINPMVSPNQLSDM